MDMIQVIAYIEKCIKEIDFGKVTVEIVSTSERIDVITEERKRIFLKKS
jgi:hypothetical protein